MTTKQQRTEITAVTPLTSEELTRRLITRGRYSELCAKILGLQPGHALQVSVEGKAANAMATIRVRMRNHGVSRLFMWRRLNDHEFVVSRIYEPEVTRPEG